MLIQQKQYRFPFYILKTDARSVGQTAGFVPVDPDRRNTFGNPRFQTVTQLLYMRYLFRHAFARQFTRLTKPNYARHILRTAAATLLC